MHGYGYPPQRQPTGRPSPTTLILLRVLFAALTVLSCGFLSWAALLRLAVVTREVRDWVLLAVAFVASGAMFAYIISTPDDQAELTDGQAIVFLVWMVCSLAGATAYYLWAEIRHFGRGPGAPGPVPYAGQVPPAAPPAPGTATRPARPPRPPGPTHPSPRPRPPARRFRRPRSPPPRNAWTRCGPSWTS
ncbi:MULTISPECIES: hypothetical protein [unclassified Streptomyces]|uniref:hypothetical protein n=1 Tax=unclassified Streptomyces TaxID=2593676 RepID=UPI00081AED4A|nr:MULTISPECIES: hypothetical protein [unclassified Streptomyces]SCE03028.1 hypothetical protein GA0115247_120729 [Streptomyces sp. PalvLS-984]